MTKKVAKSSKDIKSNKITKLNTEAVSYWKFYAGVGCIEDNKLHYTSANLDLPNENFVESSTGLPVFRGMEALYPIPESEYITLKSMLRIQQELKFLENTVKDRVTALLKVNFIILFITLICWAALWLFILV